LCLQARSGGQLRRTPAGTGPRAIQGPAEAEAEAAAHATPSRVAFCSLSLTLPRPRSSPCCQVPASVTQPAGEPERARRPPPNRHRASPPGSLLHAPGPALPPAGRPRHLPLAGAAAATGRSILAVKAAGPAPTTVSISSLSPPTALSLPAREPPARQKYFIATYLLTFSLHCTRARSATAPREVVVLQPTAPPRARSPPNPNQPHAHLLLPSSLSAIKEPENLPFPFHRLPASHSPKNEN
jgi:hypothetical protein